MNDDVLEKIKKKKKERSEKFREDDFDGMVEMYIEDGFILTPKGKVAKGKGQIKKYWADLKAEGVSEIPSDVDFVYKCEKNMKIGDERFDYLVFECCKATSNCSIWLHRVDCQEFCACEFEEEESL